MKTSVKRRPFGNTGLMVSEVSFGAMNIRNLKTSGQAMEILDFVLDQGINLIDTARAYVGVNGSGETIVSEEFVGRAIAARDDIDEPIVIVTKGHAYNPASFDADFNASIKALGVKKTDQGLFIGNTEIKLVYFFHGIKEDRWAEVKSSGAIDHALKRQAAGDFTYLGFSSHYGDGKEIKEALDTGVFQVIELPYNVFNRSLSEDGAFDFIKYAHDMGIAIVNMKAFNGNGMVPTAKIIGDVCSITYPQMLRFCLSNPYISTVDAGAKYPAEFQTDINASLSSPMGDDERTALKAEADKVSAMLNDICRECMHCLEKFKCPQGINFPDILGIHARYSISRELGKATDDFSSQYQAICGPLADACISCGECSTWCEYHLDIPPMMESAHRDLSA
ncbi:MAG: aldo/keto reductase [Christensenellales bacterium]|jgi:predicted aldo/keto reductase-like oxidoreductase